MGPIAITRVRHWFEPPQRHRLVDGAAIALSLAFVILSLVLDLEENDVAVEPWYLVLAVAGSVPLWWRRRHPVEVSVAVVAVHLLLTATSTTENGLIVASVVAFYTTARLGHRRAAILIAGLSAIATIAVVLAVDEGESPVEEVIGEFGAALLPVALGDAVRSRQDRVDAVIEAETAAKIQEERLRIARDLHDVVAHGLSAIAVQSGVAAYNLGDRPTDDPTRVALERINAAGKRSLEDLRAMVGVLRSTDDVTLRPTPTDPGDLSALRETAGLVDIDLEIRHHGSFPDDVSDATVVSLHRIAQEALTNVARHAGPVPAVVELRHHDDHVVLRVVNTTSTITEPMPSSGVGILGMRERAESVGGALTAAELLGGGFEVRATIPYRPRNP